VATGAASGAVGALAAAAVSSCRSEPSMMIISE
jgi:hypothetical protein